MVSSMRFAEATLFGSHSAGRECLSVRACRSFREVHRGDREVAAAHHGTGLSGEHEPPTVSPKEIGELAAQFGRVQGCGIWGAGGILHEARLWRVRGPAEPPACHSAGRRRPQNLTIFAGRAYSWISFPVSGFRDDASWERQWWSARSSLFCGFRPRDHRPLSAKAGRNLYNRTRAK
jgi:hypothetical protein